MRNLIVAFLLVSLTAKAQFVVRPIISQNAFQIQYYGNGTYDYGGKFGSTAFVPGLDIEYRFTKVLDSLSSPMKLATNPCFVLLFSASFWKYTNVENGFNTKGDPLSSTYQSQFIAMPLLAKYYMQLGVLNENMRIGFGLGVIGLYRLQTELHEEAILYTRDPVTNGVISQQTVEATADIAKQSPSVTIGFCLEISVEYNRFYFALRAYQSGQDQYATGFEANYGLAETQSIYQLAYKEYPKMIYTGGGVLVGWRITRLKKY
jgi:hypothetical protein